MTKQLFYIDNRTQCSTEEIDNICINIIREFQNWKYSIGNHIERYDDIVVTSKQEEMCGFNGVINSIIVADERVLDLKYSSMNADEVWDTKYKVRAVIIVDQIPHFKYEYIKFQYSPMCYLFIPSRQSYSELVSYLINQLN